MPVQSETSRIQYSGNGSEATPYAIPFLFLSSADLVVVVTDASGSETTLAETTDYTITGAGDDSGGELLTTGPVPPASTLTIYREPVATQLTEFQATGRLPASTLTEGLDRLTMLVQSLLRKVTRCLRFTDSSQHISPMPGSGRASHLLGFNSSGDAQLYDRTTLLSLLSLGGSLTPAPTAFWADDGERAAKTPDFTGQLGLQLDDSSLWRAASPTPGHWTLLALDEDALTSNSPRLPPTQQSVKAYVDAGVAAAGASASAADAAYLPPGCIMPYAGPSAPTGWLLCYGQTVSRTTYAALFTAIGTTYGSGDGTTTFHLPDLRGRVPAGKDDMGGTAASRITHTGTGNPGVNGSTLGASGGSDRHTLSMAEMPSHRHLLIADATLPNHSMALTPGNQLLRAVTPAHDLGYLFAGSDVAATIAQSSLTGSSEAHAQLQPTLILTYIIRT